MLLAQQKLSKAKALEQIAADWYASHGQGRFQRATLTDPAPGDPANFSELTAHHLDNRVLRFNSSARPSECCVGLHARIGIHFAEQCHKWIEPGSSLVDDSAWSSPTYTSEEQRRIATWLKDIPSQNEEDGNRVADHWQCKVERERENCTSPFSQH